VRSKVPLSSGERSDYIDENFEEDETEELWGLEGETDVQRRNKFMNPKDNALANLGGKK
jgi:hypothetical protein